ncbi:plasmid replication protein RepC [Ensifer sp. P24N7]|uniref:plasmid replication protein RepC n=1 Tax=Sinorhizobium sp. P24N7 TaxID=3348358 RepID=UPI0035F4F4DD
MQSGNVTTPFGRRPITLALVRQQIAATEIKAGRSADKWKVFRHASEARKELGLQDRSLAVLNALLTFYPDNELRQDGQLIVFPSNAQLTLRAHGIAGATLRRHLALLVEAGLIVRKDSANGKRYARRDRSGEVESAFGFDLSPLLNRAEELAQIAQQVAADRAALRRAKEDLTICRRNARKLITAAIAEGADGDWDKIESVYVELVRRIPRSPSLSDLDDLLHDLKLLQEEILNTLDLQRKEEFDSTNDAHNERHIQNSHTESIYELEPSSRNEQDATRSQLSQVTSEPKKRFPLGVVLKACPQIADYGPGGTVAGWRDLMSAAVVVRSMLRVSPSAYEDACDVMGAENAAVTIACILERAEHINSAGGYLRDLTSKTRRGDFSLGPVLMALLRAHGQSSRKVG